MYKMTRTVRCSDIAENGRVRLSAVLDYLQDCDYDHLQTEPALKPYFDETGNVMFLVSRQVDIMRLPEYNEKLEVSTWCYELKPMYGYRNTVIKDERGELCVRAYETGAFAEPRTQRPVRISKELAAAVTKGEKLDMEYLSRKIALPEREPDITEPLKVYDSFIDMYSHVNNARYAELSCDYIPEGREVKRFRAEYKLPLKNDGGAEIKVWNDEDKVVCEMCNREGKCCCIMEYELK